MPAQHLLLLLKRSQAQEAALQRVLNLLQDPGSPTYHKFLTPAQFGSYGAADADLATITSWLQSKGFTVDKVNQARTLIEFSGTVGQLNRAFHTSIHRYVIHGNEHYAAATSAAIPSALAPAISAISSLSDFGRPRPQHTTPRPFNTHQAKPGANFNKPVGTNEYQLLVAPADAATIYNINPVYSLQDTQGHALNGQGVTIGVAGNANLEPGDTDSYRAAFGLPPNTPNTIFAGTQPPQIGITKNGSEVEALLDVQIAGGIAPGASVDFYTADDSSFQSGVALAILQALEDNQVNVLNVSFGECEAYFDDSFYLDAWQQAAAQGITVTVSSDDSGSAGCDDPDSQSVAQYGLQVNGLASTPYNLAVGGTDFNQAQNNYTDYWSATNGVNGLSVLGYIPELPWNDSTIDDAALANNAPLKDQAGYTNIIGGGGGASGCLNATVDSNFNFVCNPVTEGSPLLGYAKPAWQVGPGVPQDGARDLPDVSLFAGNGLHYSAWAVCLSTCSLDGEGVSGIGGTSTAAPAFAGIMALIVQKYGPQGQAAPTLYALAAQHPSIFHDITTGNNSVYCVPGSPACGANSFLTGYDAAANYDLATGLGSVDVLQLVNNWGSVTYKPTTTTFAINGASTPLTFTHGTAVNVSTSVTGAGGTPSGAVALVNNSNTFGNNAEGTITLSAGSGSAPGYTDFPGGTYTAFANYGGDGVYASSRSAGIQLTVSPENSVLDLAAVVFSSTGQSISIAGQTVPFGSYISVSARPIASSQQTEQNPSARATGLVTFTDTLANVLDAAGQDQVDGSGLAEAGLHYLDAGVHTVGASYSGDASFNSSTAQPLTFTVAKAPSATALTASPLNVDPSSSVGLNATITTSVMAPPGATISFPTGTVSFTSGATSLGTASVQGAINPDHITYSFTAFLNALGSALPLGTDTIVASYSGDANFVASQSAPVVVTVAVPPPSPPAIALTFTGTPSTATAGTPFVITVSVDPENNFTGAVALTCAVTGPAAAQDLPTCLFTPAAVSVTNPTAAVQSSLTISTTAQTNIAHTSALAPGWRSAGKVMLVCLLLGFLPKRRSTRRLVLLLLCLSLTLGLSSCGGGGKSGSGNPGTTAGAYKVTFNATSGSLTATDYTTFNVSQ